MSDLSFLVLTAVAAVAFAFALLGVMTQWLKADELSGAMEPMIQRKLSDDAMRGPLMAAAHTMDDSLPASGATAGTATIANTATAENAVTATEELESYIARHIIAGGGSAALLGMVIGWFIGSFAGAVAGASVGTVLGVLAGTAVAALKRRPQ